MEHNLAIKRTEVLIHATTWVNLASSWMNTEVIYAMKINIMICEKNQTQKDKNYMIPLT